MNNYIKVVIKDDNGLCDVLLREGYSQAWIEQGKQIIAPPSHQSNEMRHLKNNLGGHSAIAGL